MNEPSTNVRRPRWNFSQIKKHFLLVHSNMVTFTCLNLFLFCSKKNIYRQKNDSDSDESLTCSTSDRSESNDTNGDNVEKIDLTETSSMVELDEHRHRRVKI